MYGQNMDLMWFTDYLEESIVLSTGTAWLAATPDVTGRISWRTRAVSLKRLSACVTYWEDIQVVKIMGGGKM